MANKMIVMIGPGGRMHAIHDDRLIGIIGHGATRRASHVEPIATGKFLGWWHVDMSPLSPDHQYCLWPPVPTRQQALSDEHDHIVTTWLKGKACQQDTERSNEKPSKRYEAALKHA